MDTPLRIRLFGAFAVHVGDQTVPEGAWRLRKAKSLLKLLALSPERRLHRERATEWLWPERTAEAAANNFHQALYVARRALESAGAEAGEVLPLRDDMLMLAPGGVVEIDVDAFDAAAAHARTTGAPDDYRAALALHGGELLPEDRYETWVTGRRDALAEARLGLLLELSDALSRAGDTTGAIEMLERAVVVDPLHEAAHRALMRLFAAAGRRQQALAQYHQLRGALRRELEAEPDPQTVSLYRTLLRGELAPEPPEEKLGPQSSRAPAPERTAPTRHNLSLPLTSFVGRERELREVDHLLDRNRLVTLTGAGGSGKTRLALEAARARVDECPDGAWLVELAGLSDPALVAHATAAALGVSLPSQRPDLDALSARLSGWSALLILDNCEHLVAACAALAERLLGACPGLRVLATSREPLRVPGEVTWRVPSLALPGTSTGVTPADIEACESVRLFCERAADVSSSFALTAENAPPVAAICCRLDGMPLALELAAARAGALSPAQIAERLGDSLTVLTAGRRMALDRQQTLRATLSWSHDLLTGDERVQFRRLAVFAGSFTLEAAEAVTAGGEISEPAVADLLGRLVDKSLVVADEDAGGYRYRLLEPMRQYAFERLVEASEAAELQSRHQRFYLKFATAGERLEADHDNLRAALAWALREQPEDALRLALHVWPMWMAGSHFKEGDRWLSAALAAAPQPTRLRADALRAACGLGIRLGRASDVLRAAAERVALLERLGARHALAQALNERGDYEYMTCNYGVAEELYSRSRRLAEETGDERVAAAVLHSVGILGHNRGDVDGAREALLESLTRLRALPQDDGEAFFHVHTLGHFVGFEGPAGAPRMYFEETLQFFRRVDAQRAVGYVLADLGDIARAQRLREPARDRLGESLAHFRDARDPMGTAFALGRLGNLVGVLGEYELAREWLEEGLALRRELGDRRAVGMMLGNLGLLAGREGDTERARALLGDALAQFEETDDVAGQMGMSLNLGNVEADAGEHERACVLLDASRVSAAQQRSLRVAGWATLTMVELALAAGDADEAGRLLDVALGYLRPVGDRWGLARCMELDQAAAKRSLSRAGEG